MNTHIIFWKICGKLFLSHFICFSEHLTAYCYPYSLFNLYSVCPSIHLWHIIILISICNLFIMVTIEQHYTVMIISS